MGDVSNKGLAWIAALALFMQALDATILNTALPAISDSLKESPLDMQMAIISYALTVAALIPLSGWLADKFGTLRVFRSAILLFVLGSVSCALSWSLNSLVVARIVQGVGGALMMPVARLTIIRSVPKTQLVATWNLMAMAGLTGPILGPILGGWLVTYTSWHWIFLINIPIGLLGIAIAGKYMPNLTQPPRKLDWIGFLLFASGLVGLTLGLEFAAEDTDNVMRAVPILTVGFILICAYCLYAYRVAEPLLPLAMFKIRTFRIGILSNMLIRLSGSGIPFLLPLMLQVAFGYSADIAGWLMAPLALSSVLAKSFIGSVLEKLGYRNTLLINALLMTCAIIGMSFLDAQSPLWLFILLVMWFGTCMSFMFTAVNTLTVCDLSDQYASAGSTMMSVVQQVGIGIGIAVSAVILGMYRANIGETDALLTQAFSYTFLTSAIFGLILALNIARLAQQDGNHLHSKTA